MDFMYYAMDQICNHAAILDYTLGGNAVVDITIRAIINRKGEQGAQHSQALHGLFNHIPGMKIVMPSNAYDAKGMLLGAISHPGLVLYIEDNELYKTEDDVPNRFISVT
jgi:pyruvate dehydrogenase E1 component beta subunit